jgi:hypothetical protein
MRQIRVFARWRKALAGLALVVLVCAGCSRSSKSSNATGGTPAASEPSASTAKAGDGRDAAKAVAEPRATAPESGKARAVQARMHNVMFHLTETASAHLENVSGELWPVGKYELVVFDDKRSFELHVADGTISISPEALATVMNSYVFAKEDAPLKDISMEIQNKQLIIKGKLHSKGDLAFETAGTLSVNPDGRLRVHTEKVKAMHVPVKKVMALFGLDLANVVNTSKIAGMDTDKNDLLMDLGELLPPPHIRGKVVGVRLQNNAIVTIFGDGGKDVHEAETEGNYMRFEGHRVQFGKLTMENTDLTVVDMDPQDPLDWDQDRYQEQLEAGYSKITGNFGLRTYVRDYGKLKRQ